MNLVERYSELKAKQQSLQNELIVLQTKQQSLQEQYSTELQELLTLTNSSTLDEATSKYNELTTTLSQQLDTLDEQLSKYNSSTEVK